MVKKLFLGFHQNTLYANNRGEQYFQAKNFELSKHITNELTTSNLEEFLNQLSKPLKKRKVEIITNLDNEYFLAIKKYIDSQQNLKKATITFQAQTFLEKEDNQWFMSIYASEYLKKSEKAIATVETIKAKPSWQEAKKLLNKFCEKKKEYVNIQIHDELATAFHQQLNKLLQKTYSGFYIFE